MQQLILIIHVLTAISIIALVLLQHGKGADIGATFGSGASQTVFGSQGSMSFLMKVTVILAVVFFATSIGLTYMAHREQKGNHLINFPIVPKKTSMNELNSITLMKTQKKSPDSSKKK